MTSALKLALACVFCAPGLIPSVAAAQDTATVQGRVADALDSPLAGAIVVLHAVGEASGVELDRDTADADGRFELAYQHRDGPLYFVATRIDGDIYMADPFRTAPATAIVLRAGAGVEPLRMEGLGPPPGPDGVAPATANRTGAHGGWWVAAIAVVLLGFVAWLVHRSRFRAPRARELMLEIARLDERRAGADDQAAYAARRAELKDRLIEALELDDDAARH